MWPQALPPAGSNARSEPFSGGPETLSAGIQDNGPYFFYSPKERHAHQLLFNPSPVIKWSFVTCIRQPQILRLRGKTSL
jgi:hypothetical protein